ncbi:hypothetical protein ACTVCO_01465 [Sanguibacter sp. A247]|uniref:hypothetical protein n=1 Tax=unclassified Sanguibacter TaxID=2645534 RepID=UPI003FD7A43B
MAPLPTSVSTTRVAASAYSDGLLRRSATVADASTSTSPSAAQRVTRIVATQDVVGRRLRATVTYAAAPTATAGSLVAVVFGEWAGTSCTPQVVLAASAQPRGATSGQFVTASGTLGGTFSVARGGSGATLTLTSSAAATFRNSNLECVFATVGSTVDGSPYQSFYAEDLAETYKPKLAVTGGEPVQGARAGKWTTLRLEVRNSGRGPAKNVKIRAKGSGMTIKKASRKLGTIDARSSEYGVIYKVKLKGAKSRKLTFTVTASGGYKTTKSFTIAREPAPKKYRSLSGRYFWGFQPTSMSSSSGWDNTTMHFLNKKWVYIGDEKGRTPTCRKTTKTCKRYTYDARRGVAKIGLQKFKVTTKGFSYRVAKGEQKSSFSPATLAKKGTRIKADLVHQDWSGFCMISCTSWTERLTLSKNGRFVWARTSIGSWPGIGSSWSSAPPDKRGTYRVVKKGVAELRYANGKKKRFTIAIDHDIRGKASPAGAGVLLGTKNFYYQD